MGGNARRTSRRAPALLVNVVAPVNIIAMYDAMAVPSSATPAVSMAPPGNATSAAASGHTY
jgi:hypothetical protein